MKALAKRAALFASLAAALFLAPLSASAGAFALEGKMIDVKDGVVLGGMAGVPLTFSCDAGEPFELNVRLTQDLGFIVAYGETATTGQCDGRVQEVTVFVFPDPEGDRYFNYFLPGKANADVSLSFDGKYVRAPLNEIELR